jgi:hypothetical protein
VPTWGTLNFGDMCVVGRNDHDVVERHGLLQTIAANPRRTVPLYPRDQIAATTGECVKRCEACSVLLSILCSSWKDFSGEMSRRPAMDILRFYWKVLRVALTHSLSRSHEIVFGIVIVLGLSAYVAAWFHMDVDFGAWASKAEGWNIAAVTLGSLVAVRLIAAPYWLWREERGRAEALHDQLED